MDKKIKTISSIVIIGVLFIGIYSGCNISGNLKYVKDTNSVVHDDTFMQNNHTQLDINDNDDFSSFSLLDSDLKNKEMFFTAENHGIKANSELELKFLKYFKKKAGIKYYLQELSYSDACFLNEYLESGDESILQELYKPLKGTFDWNKEGYNNWKKIYEFNKSLPQEEKIKIVGIDIEHQSVNALRYMNSIIPKKQAPNEIVEVIKELKKIYKCKNLNEDMLKEFSMKLQKDIQKNRSRYNEYLGDKEFDLEIVNENILNQIEVYKDDVTFDQIRDEKIYENFAKVYKHLPKGKFYGQWGLSHTFQKRQDNVDWFASQVNNKIEKMKGKILSIIYIYKDCKEMMNKDYREINITTFYSTDYNKNLINPFLKTDITLFKLNGKDSPFEKRLSWTLTEDFCGSEPSNGVTTDYFQYMVIIKNSKATTPLNK